MPWIEARLRGQKVLARARDDGTLDARGGRVEIRYRPNDGRAYQAGARNLEVVAGAPLLPDETCVAAEAPSDDAKAAKPKGGGGASAAAAPAPASIPGSWLVYTDGACSGNPGPAGAGLVVIAPDGKIREGYRWLGTATNNIAELTAIQLALEALPPDAPGAVIHTDSQYAIGILTKGWKPKANQELV